MYLNLAFSSAQISMQSLVPAPQSNEPGLEALILSCQVHRLACRGTQTMSLGLCPLTPTQEPEHRAGWQESRRQEVALLVLSLESGAGHSHSVGLSELICEMRVMTSEAMEGDGITWEGTHRLALSSHSLVPTALPCKGRAMWKIICNVLVASGREKPTI